MNDSLWVWCADRLHDVRETIMARQSGQLSINGSSDTADDERRESHLIKLMNAIRHHAYGDGEPGYDGL
jgi:hypothetical protein